MSLYERIEQEGLTSEQVNHLFREEMVRYRNMLAHQLAVIEKDGEGNVTARFHQMLSIYAAFNGDFIVVQAPKFMPQLAEDRAQEGLRETIRLVKTFDASTGLQATVEVRGVE